METIGNKDPFSSRSNVKKSFILMGLGTEGWIRTHGTLADTLVFKTRALNHSTTPPGENIQFLVYLL